MQMANKELNIPGYKIDHEIGEGGMSTVYLATQESLCRPVALKVMKPVLAAETGFAKRFLKEGQFVAQLAHPHIITVFDIGIDQFNYYLSMEYLPGGNLKERIQEGLPLEQALRLIKNIASALGFAHSRDIVHRDIKPQNILFRDADTPILTDFGIAKALSSSTTVLTAPGLWLGSPLYMSPEQASGEAIDARTDLYSLGVVFYEMLTGRPPFDCEGNIALGMMHLKEAIPELPQELAAFQPVLNKLTAKNREERFDTAEDFIAALDETESGLSSGRYPVILTAPPKVYLKTLRDWQSISDWVKEFLTWKRSAAVLGLLTALALAIYAFIPSEIPQAQQIAEFFYQRAQQFHRDGAAAASLEEIDKGLDVFPEHENLLALREKVQTKQAEIVELNRRKAEDERRQQTIQKLLAQAAQQLKDAQLIEPKGHNAYESYQEVLKLELDNAEAEAGLAKVAADYYELMQQPQPEGSGEIRLTQIDKGLELFPNHAGLLALRQEIQGQLADTLRKRADEERHRQNSTGSPEQNADSLAAREGKIGTEKVQLDTAEDETEEQLKAIETEADVTEASERAPEDTDEVARLLEKAQKQLQKRFLTTPSNDNAYDSYRQVLALDPENAEAQARLREIVRLYRLFAENSLRAGRLERSLENIEKGLRVAPYDAGLLALRARVLVLMQKETPQQETERLYQQAKQLFEEAKAASNLNLKQAKVKESLYLIHKALKISPKNSDLQTLQFEAWSLDNEVSRRLTKRR